MADASEELRMHSCAFALFWEGDAVPWYLATVGVWGGLSPGQTDWCHSYATTLQGSHCAMIPLVIRLFYCLRFTFSGEVIPLESTEMDNLEQKRVSLCSQNMWEYQLPGNTADAFALQFIMFCRRKAVCCNKMFSPWFLPFALLGSIKHEVLRKLVVY